MRLESLGSGRVDVSDNLSLEKLLPDSGQSLPQTASHLRYLFSHMPMVLSSSGHEYALPSHSAVKVQPATPVSVELPPGAALYVISFGMAVDERTYLHELARREAGFFSSLSGRSRREWDSVESQGLDYVIEGEKNADRIMGEVEGLLVAPPYSRFKHPKPYGWHLMYARGSRALSLGSDFLHEIREEEQRHAHRILGEVYVGIEGELLVEVDGAEHLLTDDSVLIVEPQEFHHMSRLLKAPYQGFTLQTPSIPDDRMLAG